MSHKKDLSNRRTFLKTAGAAAGTVLMRDSLWAQSPAAEGVSLARAGAFPKINPKFMMTPDQAWEWNAFKSQGGPTYAGGAGWKRFTEFLIAKMPELGAVTPPRIRIKVLLPAPFSPISPTTSPGPTARLTSRSACTPG